MSPVSIFSSRRQRLLGTVMVALCATSFGANAGEQEDRPVGSYRLLTSQTCIRTPFQPPPATGFDPVTFQLLTDGESIQAAGTGLLRFFRDGRVTLTEGKLTEVSDGRVAAGAIPIAPPSEFTCDGTYQVQGKKLSFGLSCDIKQASPVVTVKLTPLNFEGALGLNKLNIDVANVNRELQTVTVSVNGNPVQQRQRLCTQTASLNAVLP